MIAALTQNRTVLRLSVSLPALFSTLVIVLLILTATIGPLFFSPADINISAATLAAPSELHVMGTDELGRDVLAMIVHGARVSLYVGFSAAFVATVLGSLIGASAGFYGGKVDMAVMRVTEIFQSLPNFVLAALVVAMLGAGESRVIIVIAALAWPQTARLMRSEVLRVKQLDFVNAARCLGKSEATILLKEIIPNCLATVVALGTLIIAEAILLEASLSFFGLTNPDTISWGALLTSGQRFIYQAGWLSVFPGLAIFLTVLAFNLFGESLRQALDPKG